MSHDLKSASAFTHPWQATGRWAVLICSIALAACTLTVDSTTDEPDANPGDHRCQTASGSCTLRAAIMEANASSLAREIVVPAGLYQLTLAPSDGGGPLVISSTLSVTGAGAGATIVDAGGDCQSAFGNYQVLNITSGDVSIRHLTVRGGNAPAGGGIRVEGGSAALTDIDITDNFSSTGGAGLLVAATAQATVRRATIRGNCSTGSFGGGIWNTAQLFVHDSLIADNTAVRAAGIRNAGSMELRNSTVSGNSAVSPLGGVGGISQQGFAVLNNVTITQNSSVQFDPGSFQGSGIQTGFGQVTVLKNSIVAENDGAGGPNDCVGELTADSVHNLIGDRAGCEFTGSTETYILDVNPGLAPLANNGGPTQTHALLPTSPAREAGYPLPPPALHACEATDQRGVSRPQGDGVCDLGAFEFTGDNAP